MAVAKSVIIIKSLKLILMSSGIVFIALLISLSFPSLSSSTHHLPSLLSSLKSWLQPPYLYFFINFIILTIAVSSRLHHHHHAPSAKSDFISPRADQFSPFDAVSVAAGHVASFSPKSDVISVRGDHFSPSDAVSVAGGHVASFSPKSDVISVRGDHFSPYDAVSVAGGCVSSFSPKSDVISVRGDHFSPYDAVSVAGGHVSSFSSKSDVISVRADQISPYDAVSVAGGHVSSFSPKSDVISVRGDHFSPYDAVSVSGGHVGSFSPKSDLVTVRADQFSDAGGRVGTFFDAVSVASVEVVEEKSVGLETVMEDEVADLTVEKEEEKSMVEERSTWSAPRQHGLRRQEEEKSMVEERSTWSVPRQQGLRRQEPVEISLWEKPLVTSRFGHHRKHAKLGPAEGGKALRVAKPKKHDTFESTWKAITEGRHVPLTRHNKNKSDTWQYQCRQINLLEDPIPPPKPVKKSETFKDRTNHKSPPVVASSKLKKEPSLGQDELNRRVEAFINKFNDEMRLQRQQSMQQFLEKINRAA